MESVIIEEMRAFMQLDLNPRQKQYFADIYRNVYIERVKDNPRRNEVTPGVGTQ